MHAEALGGGVIEFDAAIEARACPFLNQLGEVALGEMRAVYEQVDAGDYAALGELAERLAAAAVQKASSVSESTATERPPERSEKRTETVLAEKPTERLRTERDKKTVSLDLSVDILTIAPRRDAEELPVADPLVEAVRREPPIERTGHDHPMALDEVRVATRRIIELDAVAIPIQALAGNVELAAREELSRVYGVTEQTRQRQAAETELAPSPQGESLDHESDALSVDEAAEGVTWVYVLEKEPLEIYTEFTEVLHSLVVAIEVVADNDTEELAVFDELELIDEQRAVEEVPSRPEAVPVIALTVAECLAKITPEEKEAVAPMLAQVVAAVQAVEALKALEEEVVEPEQMEVAIAQLEEQIRVLFDQLGVEYEVEDIQLFAALLLRPDFRPSQPELTEGATVDLEHDGTHETKKDFRQLISDGVTDLEYTIERLLGNLVLLRPSANEQQQLVAAKT